MQCDGKFEIRYDRDTLDLTIVSQDKKCAYPADFIVSYHDDYQIQPVYACEHCMPSATPIHLIETAIRIHHPLVGATDTPEGI